MHSCVVVVCRTWKRCAVKTLAGQHRPADAALFQHSPCTDWTSHTHLHDPHTHPYTQSDKSMSPTPLQKHTFLRHSYVLNVPKQILSTIQNEMTQLNKTISTFANLKRSLVTLHVERVVWKFQRKWRRTSAARQVLQFNKSSILCAHFTHAQV